MTLLSRRGLFGLLVSSRHLVRGIIDFDRLEEDARVDADAFSAESGVLELSGGAGKYLFRTGS